MIAAVLLALPQLIFRQAWRIELPDQAVFFPMQALTIGRGQVIYTQDCTGGRSAYGAIDIETGRPLWRVVVPDPSSKILFENNRLIVATGLDIRQVDPSNGETLWRKTTSPGAGPFVKGDRMVLETASGILEAFDLRTHRSLWTTRQPLNLSGLKWGAVGCLTEKALWIATASGEVAKISAADGRVEFSKPYVGGRMTNLIPFRDAMALVAERDTEVWRSDGQILWRPNSPLPRIALYSPLRDELAFAHSTTGFVRFRASDGLQTANPLPSFNPERGSERFLVYGGGYALLTSKNMLMFDAEGHPTGGADLPTIQPLTTVTDGKNLFYAWSDYIVCLRPVGSR